jgi:hypothetical protein
MPLKICILQEAEVMGLPLVLCLCFFPFLQLTVSKGDGPASCAMSVPLPFPPTQVSKGDGTASCAMSVALPFPPTHGKQG